MQLTCKHCGYISKSLSVIKDSAIADVMLDFSKHMTQQHTGKKGEGKPFEQWMLDCQMLASVGPTVILVAKHSTLLDVELDTDDYIQEKFSLLVDQIQDNLGVEVFDNKPSNSIDGGKEGGEIDTSNVKPDPSLSLPQRT